MLLFNEKISSGCKGIRIIMTRIPVQIIKCSNNFVDFLYIKVEIKTNKNREAQFIKIHTSTDSFI